MYIRRVHSLKSNIDLSDRAGKALNWVYAIRGSQFNQDEPKGDVRLKDRDGG